MNVLNQFQLHNAALHSELHIYIIQDWTERTQVASTAHFWDELEHSVQLLAI